MPTKPPSLAQRNIAQKRRARKAEAGVRRMTKAGAAIDDMRNSGRWQKLRSIVRHKQPICRDPFGTHRETGIVTQNFAALESRIACSHDGTLMPVPSVLVSP